MLVTFTACFQHCIPCCAVSWLHDNDIWRVSGSSPVHRLLCLQTPSLHSYNPVALVLEGWKREVAGVWTGQSEDESSYKSYLFSSITWFCLWSFIVLYLFEGTRFATLFCSDTFSCFIKFYFKTLIDSYLFCFLFFSVGWWWQTSFSNSGECVPGR